MGLELDERGFFCVSTISFSHFFCVVRLGDSKGSLGKFFSYEDSLKFPDQI